MIQFKDFTIKMTKPPGFLNNPEFEPLDESLIRMNAWIEKNEIIVLNVETLLMPNIFDGSYNRTSTLGGYKQSSSEANWWYQIFRVWFQEETND